MAKTTQKKQKRKVAKEFEVHSSEFPKKKAPKLTLEDTLKLQEAVARDTEATDFAIEVARLRDGGRNVLNKMKTDGGASI